MPNTLQLQRSTVLLGLRKSFLVVLAGILVSSVIGVLPAQATDTSLTSYLNNQYYNQIAPDGDFANVNAMSVGDIQGFLEGKGSALASTPSSQLGDGANGRSAAQIIYDAAKGLYDAAVGCSGNICINSSTGTVSPKTILITLQKEQSLVTPFDPSRDYQRALDCAMGYESGQGCQWMFDNRPQWKGFSNQVGWAAWNLRLHYERSVRQIEPYYMGKVVTVSDPDGARSVYLSNHTTAALIRYTPHTYYGNWNFWKLGVEWFGFGTGGGYSGGVNDLSSSTGRMYISGKYTVKSYKQTDARVYFGDTVVAELGSGTWEYQFDPALGTNTYNFTYKLADGSTLGVKSITIEKRKNGDINGDNTVNILDLSLIGTNWGYKTKDDDWMNLNPGTDNEINLLDISIFANSWEG